MKCEQVEKLLTEDYSGRSARAVAEHLESCLDCRRLSEDLLVLEELTREMAATPPASPSMRETLLKEASRALPAQPPLLKPLLVGLVLVASMGTFSTSEPTLVPDPAGELSSYQLGVDRPVAVTDRPYVDVILTDSPRREYILRLPSVIQVHRTDLHEDFYFNNVSH